MLNTRIDGHHCIKSAGQNIAVELDKNFFLGRSRNGLAHGLARKFGNRGSQKGRTYLKMSGDRSSINGKGPAVHLGNRRALSFFKERLEDPIAAFELEALEWVSCIFLREHFVRSWLALHCVGNRSLGGFVVVLVNLGIVFSGWVNEHTANNH